MAIPGSAGPFLLAQLEEEGGYEIERSLRFNSSDSAFLSRTPASAGNRKTWTWAGWFKPSNFFGNFLASGTDANNISVIYYNGTTNTISYYDYVGSSFVARVETTAVFRDPSAWYHLTVALDTTQATASNRVKIYINGSQLTSFSPATYPSQNSDSFINSTNEHVIGRESSFYNNYSNFYLADIHFIDGQALDPTSFGEFDTNGIWQPKAFAGSYGSQGWHLDFADNSSNTATTLGKDTSGNGNNWTPNNLAVGSAEGWDKSQVWSNTASGSFNPTFPASHAFNGQHQLAGGFDQTYAVAADPAGGTFTITSLTPNAAAEVGVYQSASVSASNLVVNGVSVGAGTGSFESKVYTGLSVNGSGNLTVNFKNPSGTDFVSIGYIKVNGKFLVDPGVIDPSDCLVDVPTNGGQTDTGAGGEVRGNYAVLNPLFYSTNRTYSNGNLELTTGTTEYRLFIPTIACPAGSGKWYVEMTLTTAGFYTTVGIYPTSLVNSAADQYPGDGATTYGYTAFDGKKRNSGVSASYGSTWTSGDTIGIAFDAENGTLTFYKNGASQGQAYSGISTSTPFYICGSDWDASSSATCAWNFGQRPFAYTAPSGFKALNTANLPAPVVTKPSTVFDTKLYTGNGSTQTISGLEFSPDFVWTKARNTNYSHQLIDIIRGGTNVLFSDRTDAEGTFQSITSFNSDGYTVSTELGVNGSGTPFVAWAWDAGTTTTTNTQGSITSQVRANASAGFSVVTWTADNTTATVGHGLGVAPSLVIMKDRDSANEWFVYVEVIGQGKYLALNRTDTVTSAFSIFNPAPTSTVLSPGSSVKSSNGYGKLVAYCFAPVAGYSSFGSYTGNGSADGPFVYTGFRPRWVMVKRTDSTGNWIIWDAARSGYNAVNDTLAADSSNAENALTNNSELDILSNGFKLRVSRAILNASAGAYVYACFSEHPFQYARAR